MRISRFINMISRGRAYIFSPTTKAIEFLNGLCLFFFSGVLSINGFLETNISHYIYFDYVDTPWIAIGMFVLSIIQLWVFTKSTLESNILSVIVLRLSSFTWVMWGLFFGTEYIFRSTGFFTYLSIALVCLLASFEQGVINRYEDATRKNCRKV